LSRQGKGRSLVADSITDAVLEQMASTPCLRLKEIMAAADPSAILSTALPAPKSARCWVSD